MGTSSGTNFNPQQLGMPPSPSPNSREATLQTSLSLCSAAAAASREQQSGTERMMDIPYPHGVQGTQTSGSAKRNRTSRPTDTLEAEIVRLNSGGKQKNRSHPSNALEVEGADHIDIEKQQVLPNNDTEEQNICATYPSMEVEEDELAENFSNDWEDEHVEDFCYDWEQIYISMRFGKLRLLWRMESPRKMSILLRQSCICRESLKDTGN